MSIVMAHLIKEHHICMICLASFKKLSYKLCYKIVVIKTELSKVSHCSLLTLDITLFTQNRPNINSKNFDLSVQIKDFFKVMSMCPLHFEATLN